MALFIAIGILLGIVALLFIWAAVVVFIEKFGPILINIAALLIGLLLVGACLVENSVAMGVFGIPLCLKGGINSYTIIKEWE